MLNWIKKALKAYIEAVKYNPEDDKTEWVYSHDGYRRHDKNDPKRVQIIEAGAMGGILWEYE